MTHMLKIGLTGGIGSGKTTVTEYIRHMGVPVIDADDISRALTAPGGAALPAIRAAFGSCVFRDDGTLDRKTLAERVFSDGVSRIQLNGIIHPKVIDIIKAQMDAWASEGAHIAVVSVPLLFEAGMQGMFDRTLLIATPRETQLTRVMARDALDVADARKRVDAQLPLDEKRLRADDVIENDGDPETLYNRVDALFDKYRRLYNAV